MNSDTTGFIAYFLHQDPPLPLSQFSKVFDGNIVERLDSYQVKALQPSGEKLFTSFGGQYFPGIPN